MWYENDPESQIMKLSADDYDSDKNGPPFSFLLDDSADQTIRDRFEVRDGWLYATTTFDREERKYYDLPISITDHGSPSKNGVSNLRVVIGDKNDNSAKDGSSFITVYKYEVTILFIYFTFIHMVHCAKRR